LFSRDWSSDVCSSDLSSNGRRMQYSWLVRRAEAPCSHWLMSVSIFIILALFGSPSLTGRFKSCARWSCHGGTRGPLAEQPVFVLLVLVNVQSGAARQNLVE